MRAARQAGGLVGLRFKPKSGRPRKLTQRQERTVLAWVAKPPTAFGFANDLWTTRRLATLIKERWLLEEVPELRLLIIDGAGRPIRRPRDKQSRKDDYSGKKKAHRKKNLLISSEKRVVYLGATSPGSVHDKKQSRREQPVFSPDAVVLKDTGFQGYEPPDCATLPPRKKPRGRELPASSLVLRRVSFDGYLP